MFKNKVRYDLKDYWKELDNILNPFNYGVGNYFGDSYIYSKDVVKNSKTIIYCKYFEFVENTAFDKDLTALYLFNSKTAKDEIVKILIYCKSISDMLKENNSLSGNKTKMYKKSMTEKTKRVKCKPVCKTAVKKRR